MSREEEETNLRTKFRTRSSIDVERPPVDPSIVGIPQGWEDDPTVTVPKTVVTLRQPKSPPVVMTPLRSRVKLASLGVRQRQLTTSDGKHTTPSNQSSHPWRGAPGEAVAGERPPYQAPRESTPRIQRCRQSSLFRMSPQREGEESVYCVGYEREVLDAEARLHEDMFLVLGTHCLASFDEEPERILDLGTGLGLWPISMASSQRKAHIVGFDLVPCQIDLSKLQNPYQDRITWLQGDFLQPLPFESSSFDYVHMRLIGLGVPENSWPSLLDEACRVLRSGGKLEIVDMTYQLPGSPSSFQDSFRSLLTVNGVSDTPSRSINFVLPMLDYVHPPSIQPVFNRQVQGSARASIPLWMSSALRYRSSFRALPETLHEACDSLRWHDQEPAKSGPPKMAHITAWVITRL